MNVEWRMGYLELVKRIASETNFSTYEVKRILNAFSTISRETLIAGRDVHISGLGTLVNSLDRPRIVRNPKTGKHMIRGMTRRIRFEPTSELRKLVRTSQHYYEHDMLRRFGIPKEDAHGEVQRGHRPGEGRKRKIWKPWEEE